MRNHVKVTWAIAVLFCAIPLTSSALQPYSQDFEGLMQSDPNALADDGWLVFGNVFTPDDEFIYGYGPFPAPNDGFAFYQIATGEGGTEVYNVDIPHGGETYLVGNLIQQSASSANRGIVTYAAEGAVNPVQQFYAVNNTIVNDASSGTFINLYGAPTARVQNNLFVGLGTPEETGIRGGGEGQLPQAVERLVHVPFSGRNRGRP